MKIALYYSPNTCALAPYIGARFGQRDVGSECAGVRGIVKSDFHLCLLISVIDHCESSALAVLDFFEKLFGLLFVLSIVGKLCGESPNEGEKTSRYRPIFHRD